MLVLWLASSCSSVESRGAPGGEGGAGGSGSASGGVGGAGAGAGGVGGRGVGGTGAGGAGVGGDMTNISVTSVTCVPSCTSDSSVSIASFLASEPARCPDGYVTIETCAPDSCARNVSLCCDGMTGVVASAPCLPSNVRDACPAGSRTYAPMQAVCIPDGLGVSHCRDLTDRECTLEGQRCQSDGYSCHCWTGAGQGLSWTCFPPPPIPG